MHWPNVSCRIRIRRIYALAAAPLVGLALIQCQVRLLADDHAAQGPSTIGKLGALSVNDVTTGRRESPQSPKRPPRLREGTQITDRVGRFQQEGETLSFVEENGRALGGLPNLNLERIQRMLKAVENPERVKWTVSGIVTEYSGSNYILISRATYSASVHPPKPEKVGD